MQYPGCVVLNHPVFQPREGRVRTKQGKSFVEYPPEPVDALQLQIKLLGKAIAITKGHFEEAKVDNKEAHRDLVKLKKQYSGVQDQIKECKARIRAAQEENEKRRKKVEEVEERTRTKQPTVDKLEYEKERLLKRTREVKALIATHKEDSVKFKCKGCKDDVKSFLEKFESSKDVLQEKRTLAGALKEELEHVESALKSINYRVAGCIRELKNINESVIAMSFGDRKKTMIKWKDSYAIGAITVPEEEDDPEPPQKEQGTQADIAKPKIVKIMKFLREQRAAADCTIEMD